VGQNLLVEELGGVLGRLHSIEGLVQTNNNAKLNKGAKQVTKVADYKRKSEGTDATNCCFFAFFGRPQN
jgi:hypothetical protein